MAKLSLTGTGNIHAIAKLISDEIQRGTCDLVEQLNYTYDTAEVIIMIFEKFYIRANNRVSLTVVVSGTDDEVKVDAVSSGAGQGVLFKWDWGSEENFVDAVENILKEKGFK